ncbi:MAG: hypothetical protein A2W99_03080 [Bacteroidetes bacterium GWF2_33_16]|nr:MAG: hypothetical protein A2X00_09935 [Bacteroidetes bacterium GWE2_32_14]OFY07878.1 MAG: hypothetical protein A2W99_03080 [Bacteroidetes bacterium GWF2_33_16]
MKKTNFLKISLTLVMALLMYGANAQWISSATQAVDSVTIGVTVPYYVQPDAYFNPLFAAPSTNVVSTFVWSVPITPALGVATPSGGVDNYIEYTFTGATGTYGLSVVETAPAPSTCPGAAVTMSVEVIATPSVAFTANNPGSFIGADLEVCEGDVLLEDEIQVAFTHFLAGIPSITLDYSLVIDTISAGGTTANYSTTPNVITGLNTATYNLAKTADPLVCIVNPSAAHVTTVYTYTVNGVNDRISRKADFLGVPLLYSAIATPIVITVHPAPVTGPIYHISNMWYN